MRVSDQILILDKLCRIVDGTKRIIDSVSYTFSHVGIYTIVGPSGSGKTSFLRLLNRLDEKSSGHILFHDIPIEDYPVTELRRRVGLAFQEPYLFPGTVATNLGFACATCRDDDSEFTARYLRLVGLDPGLATADSGKLSVGQKQRVALSRLLVSEPEILLLDEPTSALDLGAIRTIEELIVRINRELGLTIIMVTHNVEQAQRLDGESLFFVDGRLIESGASRELFANPADEMTRKFVNGDLR